MTISDYEKVYELWTGASGMGMRRLDDSKAGIETFLRRNPTTNLVAVIEDEIAGVILSGHDGRRGYIYHAAVRAEHRRRGIGKMLVSEVMAALEKEGINKVALVVFSSNEPGNLFWERVGFRERLDLIYRDKSINSENI